MKQTPPIFNKFIDAKVPDHGHAESYENTVNIFLSEQKITLSDVHLDPTTDEFRGLVEIIKTNIALTARMPDALFVTLFENLKNK
ncbi:MAG: hypothetical protein KG003_04460 [Bacteroidetes bacterium]|nr:hypothetical protein [Bacteroidota bacterium]MBS3922745.1 hypothetical protein [Nitrosarchaeum sp.]